MKQYDVKCPLCGTVNKGLYLDETEGWMICENCGQQTRSMEYARKHMKRIPVFRMRDETQNRTTVSNVV